MRWAARVAKANDEVVRADLAVPHLDFLDAVLGGAEDQAVEGDALEVEVVLLLDVLIVGAVSPVVPVRAQKTRFVIVIGAVEKRFGLLVDSLVGEEELVIKALPSDIVSSDLVSGASILGDGTVVLILNVPAVVSRFSKALPMEAIA